MDKDKYLKFCEKALNDNYLVTISDKEGNIVYANENFCKFYKKNFNDIKGKNYSFLRHPESSDRFYKKFWEKLNAKKSYKGIFKNKSNNKTVYINQTITPILDDNGEIEGFISIGQDITDEIKQTEKISKELAKNSEKVKYLESNILYLFTHELKTPLSAILNFSQLIDRYVNKIENSRIKDKIKELNKFSYQNALLLKSYIENFLNVKKFQQNRYKINVEKIDIVKLIKDIINRYNLLFSKKVNFSCDKSIFVESDGYLLNTLLENIIINALKYSKSEVNIGIIEKKEFIEIYVEDDGEGIKKEEKERIFEKFYSLKTKQNQGTTSGTGVGLYLVKKICDIFNYKVEVDSSEKLGGAKFIVTITKKVEAGG